MLVESVMSKNVQTLSPDAAPSEAIRVMDEHKIRHIPVIEEARLVGVVSDRDLLAATGWFPRSDMGSVREIRSILHAPVRTLDPQDQLVTASLELILFGIGCMPVVDDGQVVGIVTDTDLLRTFVRSAQGGKLTGDPNPAVSTLMTGAATTITPSTSFAEARVEMRTHKIRHLPVVEGERLVGILSDRDLRWADGRELHPDTPVEDFMSDFVISIDPAHPVSKAAELMVEHHISALPVVDEGRLSGILTSADLLDHCLHTLWEPEGIPPRR